MKFRSFFLFFLFIFNYAHAVNTIVAVVNDQIISSSDLNKFSSFKNISNKVAIDILVDRKVYSIIAKKLQINVSQRLMNSALFNLAEELKVPLDKILKDRSFEIIKLDIYFKILEQLIKERFFASMQEFISKDDLSGTSLGPILDNILTTPSPSLLKLKDENRDLLFDIWINKSKSETYIELFHEKII